MFGQPGYVDMSNGIELKEVPTGKIGRDQGDVHSYGNPHFTLNPQIAQRMAVTLVKAMIAADPANADSIKPTPKRSSSRWPISVTKSRRSSLPTPA